MRIGLRGGLFGRRWRRFSGEARVRLAIAVHALRGRPVMFRLHLETDGMRVLSERTLMVGNHLHSPGRPIGAMIEVRAGQSLKDLTVSH